MMVTKNTEPREQGIAKLCALLLAMEGYEEVSCTPSDRRGTYDIEEIKSKGGVYCVEVHKYSPQHGQVFWCQTYVFGALLDELDERGPAFLARLISQRVARIEEALPPPPQEKT